MNSYKLFLLFISYELETTNWIWEKIFHELRGHRKYIQNNIFEVHLQFRHHGLLFDISVGEDWLIVTSTTLEVSSWACLAVDAISINRLTLPLQATRFRVRIMKSRGPGGR